MKSKTVENRIDFKFVFDVTNGNPNGDPDRDGSPRLDYETQLSIISDACVKRKIRNFIELSEGLKAPNDIMIRSGNVLNNIIEKTSGDNISERQLSLCEQYYDIRAFGGVVNTGAKPSGTITGPVQIGWSRSMDRVSVLDISLTRCCVTTEKDAKDQETREAASTFGHKSIIPYALYTMSGHVSVSQARKTGFSENDLALLWKALINAFENDRASGRGEMSPRKLIAFRHDSYLGNAPSSKLLERINFVKKVDAPRCYDDYSFVFDDTNLPSGVTVEHIF